MIELLAAFLAGIIVGVLGVFLMFYICTHG
jgi:hypothetical protein